MIGDLFAFLVFAFIDKGGDGEAGFGSRGLNVLGHDVQRTERMTGPLDADETEQTMLDWIPFRGSGRVVADRNGDAVAPGDFVRQGGFPEARAVAGTASTSAQQ